MAICAFASEPIKGMKIEDYPMCEGSRSTESIQRLLACKILGVPYCWHINNIGNMGIQTIVPYSPNGEYTSEQITEIVRRTQSWGLGHPPYKLLNKEVDLIFLTNETKERFDSLTVIYGIEVHEKEIGMDGLAILVNDDNPVKACRSTNCMAYSRAARWCRCASIASTDAWPAPRKPRKAA